VVERRLEELVLKHETLGVAQAGVDRGQGVREAVLAAADVALAWVVGAVGEPDLQVAGSGGVHDVEALEVVVDGFLAYGWVGVGEAAELVGLVLEGIGVHGAERETKIGGVAAQDCVVVGLVPGNVQGNRG
jgi:hypothetical protein